MDFTFFMNFAGGLVYQQVYPEDIKVSLSLERGVHNDFIQRMTLKGTFCLTQANFDTAKTFFITNGNEEVPLLILEDNPVGIDIEKYSGWAKVNGKWDNANRTITFNSFRTNDVYTELLPLLDTSFRGENLLANGTHGWRFQSQKQSANTSIAYLFEFNGTSFTFGNSVSIPNLGYCSVAFDGARGEMHVWDTCNYTLKGYLIGVMAWYETRSLTISGQSNDITAITMSSANEIVLLTDRGGYLSRYTTTGSTYSLVATSHGFVEDVRFPSMALVGSSVVLVDELKGALRTIGLTTFKTYSELTIGDMTRPAICLVQQITTRLALVDAKRKLLEAYTLSGGVYSKVGNSFSISETLYNPKICYFQDNEIIFHDTIAGILRCYQFDGTDWTIKGNSYTFGAGYMSGIGMYGGYGMMALSDTHLFAGSLMHTYRQLVNNLLYMLDLNDVAPFLEIPASNDSTINLDNLVFGDMGDIADNNEDKGAFNYYEYTLKDCFEWLELFQNYWYVDSNYKIKFTQPDQFSTFGTDIDLRALNLDDYIDQETYKNEFNINREEYIFNNGSNLDFRNNYIEYSRNTQITETKRFPFTTDLDYLVDYFTGQVLKEYKKTGLIMYYDSGTNFTNSGTGIISGVDTRNYLMSQSQLYNDYLKGYRYKAQGNISINRSSSAVQNSVRNIIEYTEIKVSKAQAGLTMFPTSVANVILVTGETQFIEEFSIELLSGIITIRSRLLDI